MKKCWLIFFSFFFISLLPCHSADAQAPRWGKLSPMLRQMVRGGQQQPRYVTAFVRITSDADEVLSRYHSQSLAQAGNVHVASIPVSQLRQMSLDRRVARIEAHPMAQILTDSMAAHLNALPAYEGRNLPKAFTGKGVVVGVMDIGFDLTHPNFYTRDLQDYRIKRLWDMLSTDTVGSRFIVGRDYSSPEALQTIAHSYDGLHQTHGTHTLGIAAGSGYDSPYRGMAPDADICLVANATSNNANLIDSTLYDRFTFATDALGFKYIFDYAAEVGKPCVVSFSEGSGEDYWGYDLLYYEMLSQLVGPGRILVAAAGNLGHVKSWFRKQRGVSDKGTFLSAENALMRTLKSADNFSLRVVAYGTSVDTLLVDSRQVLAQPDSLFRGHLASLDSVEIQAYPSCYDASEICYDVVFYAKRVGPAESPLSLEVMGIDADIEFWRVNGNLVENDFNPSLCAGEPNHNIHSPASSPRVICATTHRDGIRNLNGEWKSYWQAERGMRAPFSSVGPTTDGRTKPDVMAPGNNIISSYSSYYLETHPNAGDIQWDVAHFDFQGRTYPWNSNTGTSQSCPAVAGAIALWLQAKPDLTPEEALGVISRTSRHPDQSLNYPNNEYGYGEIDVYRGLLDILGVDKVEGLSACHTQADVRTNSQGLTVALPQPAPADFRLRLFSLSGKLLKDNMLRAGECHYSLPLAGIPSGIYVVQINGSPCLEGSTIIRWKQ